jgi:hemerythrin
MEPFQWNDKYATQISGIDAQHKKLFEILNEFFYAIREHKKAQEMLPIAKELEDYTHYHFAYEEKNLRQFGYSQLEQHIKQHDIFRGKVTEFKQALEKGKLENPLEMLDFLTDWLVDHILIKDKKYVPLLQKHESELLPPETSP